MMIEENKDRAQDRKYMLRAIELARKGKGRTNPNPLVGAVIVKDGRIIGEGYHAAYGELHAERHALASLTGSAEGACIYVTLEPCCHYGKQPPCTAALLEHKIRRVVIGSRDPNPKVAGKGAKILRDAGVQVEEDFMREECDRLNPVFFRYITTGLPFVTMKYAMTADGKICTVTGASRWITGEEARARVQEMRSESMAVLAGIGTVLADDPMLNVRIEGKRQPVRVICDSDLRIPTDSRIVQTAPQYPTIVACRKDRFDFDAEAEPGALEETRSRIGASEQTGSRIGASEQTGSRIGAAEETENRIGASEETENRIGTSEETENRIGTAGEAENRGTLSEKARFLRDKGVRLLPLPAGPDGRIDLKTLMESLGRENIDSVFVEGGGTLNQSLVKAGLVHKVYTFVAPKLFGGGGKSPIEGSGVETPEEAVRLKLVSTEQIGEDLLLEFSVLENQVTAQRG